MRAAIYYTPPPEAEATHLAGAWLGRDAFTGAATRPADAALDALVAEPARYGFHATMKAPFSLPVGRDLAELDATLEAFCDAHAALTIPSLSLRRIDGFFALVPEAPFRGLDALAAEAVRAFEPFRTASTSDEITRRRPERLTERQRAHLLQWGYPFVFEEFRFHMTLTGRLVDAAADDVEAALRERLASILDQPLAVDALAVFVEPNPGSPFIVRSLHPLRSPSQTAFP